MARERRKRTRIPAGFDINIVYKRKKIKVRTINISLTGICCTNDPSFCANELCKVIFSLDLATNLTIKGKILRIDESEAIIAFVAMDEDTFCHLKKLMQYNCADPDRIEKELTAPAFKRNGLNA